MAYPRDRLYTPQHEWVLRQGDLVKVGITGYASQALGEVVYVELPEEGAELAAGATLATLESVKTVSDVYCPLAARVAEANRRLEDEPGLINRDPYGEGWLAFLRPAGSVEEAALLDAAAYARLVEEGT